MQVKTFPRTHGHYVIPPQQMEDFWREQLSSKADLLASGELKELGLTPKKLEYLFKKLRASENSSIQYAGARYSIEIVRLAGSAKTYITHIGLMTLKSYLKAKQEGNAKKRSLQQKISELEAENELLKELATQPQQVPDEEVGKLKKKLGEHKEAVIRQINILRQFYRYAQANISTMKLCKCALVSASKSRDLSDEKERVDRVIKNTEFLKQFLETHYHFDQEENNQSQNA